MPVRRSPSCPPPCRSGKDEAQSYNDRTYGIANAPVNDRAMQNHAAAPTGVERLMDASDFTEGCS